MSTLTEKEENLLKQAKLLMVRADRQEKNHNKTVQKQAEQTRQRLAHVLTQLHVIGDMDRNEELAQQWDDWCIQRGNVHRSGSCADRILYYVQQQGVYEGTMRRLANAVGAAKSTVHEAVKHLVEDHKISVEETGSESFLMVAL